MLAALAGFVWITLVSRSEPCPWVEHAGLSPG